MLVLDAISADAFVYAGSVQVRGDVEVHAVLRTGGSLRAGGSIRTGNLVSVGDEAGCQKAACHRRQLMADRHRSPDCGRRHRGLTRLAFDCTP